MKPLNDARDTNEAYFRTLQSWDRIDDPDGGEIIVLRFAEGGTVNVFTTSRLLWIEPESH